MVYFYDQLSRRLVESRNDDMLPISTVLKGSGTRRYNRNGWYFLLQESQTSLPLNTSRLKMEGMQGIWYGLLKLRDKIL